MDNDFGWDMYNGSPGARIESAINTTPTYASGNGWKSGMDGQYQLAPGSPGYDQGEVVAHGVEVRMGGGIHLAAPDVGAGGALLLRA